MVKKTRKKKRKGMRRWYVTSTMEKSLDSRRGVDSIAGDAWMSLKIFG
jgi:hypothetical protein